MSITATPDKADIIEILEPNASSIPERMTVMNEAARNKFRTYAMLCPLMPAIADDSKSIDEMVKFAAAINAEDIFAEPINPRGASLKNCQNALELWEYEKEAKAFESIRNGKYRERY